MRAFRTGPRNAARRPWQAARRRRWNRNTRRSALQLRDSCTRVGSIDATLSQQRRLAVRRPQTYSDTPTSNTDPDLDPASPGLMVRLRRVRSSLGAMPRPRNRRPITTRSVTRRGRGVRGPVLPRSVPAWRSRAEKFDLLVLEAFAPLDANWHERLTKLDIAVDEVPKIRPIDPDS